MPRKPQEENPTMHGDAKMSEETRKEVFGKSEKESAPSDAEGTERQREFSGPSEAGKKDSGGSDKHS
ncbi:hypothetical protein [Archangium sp.]|uniref:hypothetical protein n=1 Tax=Archangium sp. TaxID=1872627 RepID=UPI002D28F6BE|nr:hypothetical protein [Archangium sp.]HYO57028.1 hypothetical protein [Archangium sp.]